MLRTLVVVVSTALALVAAEIFLRVFAPVAYEQPPDRSDPTDWNCLIHQPSAVPGLEYEIAPNTRQSPTQTREGINRFGFRGREPGESGAATRIVVLGDSFTYGLGVPARDTYPAALQRVLAQTPGVGPVDVLNLGVTAYSVYDEALVLAHKVAPLAPDLVIVGFVLNDPQSGTGGEPLRVFYHDVRWWQHSHLLRLIAEAWRDLGVRRRGAGDPIRALYAPGGDWEKVPATLESMRRTSRELGVEVVFVVWPMIPEETWTDYAYAGIHEQIDTAVRQAGFPVLDLRAALQEYDPAQLRLAGDWHPTALGYEVGARAIRDFLVERQLLPKSAGG
ncbi:MAG: SGNH/GDSL hydrolase family protein [Gemmatimonadetes bacterium]|nr:SGNH/GDSL hydrolase family protein [Gemmatimonadota bacterium]